MWKQENPSICRLSNDSIVVTWQSDEQDGEDFGVYAKIFNSTLDNQTSEFLVNTNITNIQQKPSVSRINNNSFIIVWESRYQDGDGYGIYAKIFNLTGNNQTDEFQVNTYTNNSQQNPCVCSLTNGNFIITWDSLGQDGYQTGVFMKMFNSTGHNMTDDIQVNGYYEYIQSNPSICYLSNNSFAVSWASENQDGDNYGVFAKIFNSSCHNQTGDIQVNTYFNEAQSHPSMSNFSNGYFVITWQSVEQDGDGYGVFYKLFDSNGKNLTDDIQANTFWIDYQRNPSVHCYLDNNFVIVWDGEEIIGDYQDIFFKVIRYEINSRTTNPLESIPLLLNNSSNINSEIISIFIILAIIAISTLGIVSYKLKNKENLTPKIKNFIKQNFLGLIITERPSGNLIYKKYFKNELKEPYLISGFLTAIQAVDLGLISSNVIVKKLSFKNYQIKSEEGEYTTVNFILSKHPIIEISDLIFKKLKNFIREFESLNKSSFKNKKSHDKSEEIDNLIQEIIFE